MKKIIFGMALALVALLATAGSAAAYTATVDPAGEIEAISRGKVDFEASGITISCNLTLTGELEGTIVDAEQAGRKMGEITEVAWSSCSGGSVRTVLGLSWDMETVSVNGTLPNAATSLNFVIKNAQFQLAVLGGFVNCLYAGDAAANLAVSGSNPYTTGIITTNSSYRLVSGALCPGSGRMTGSFALEPSQEITLS